MSHRPNKYGWLPFAEHTVNNLSLLSQYTMKKDQSGGCIELEMPYATLHTCERLDTGQVIYVSGTAKREGMTKEENIQIQMKKKQNETISLSLYAESLGSILQDKLKERWHCILECIISADGARYTFSEQSTEAVFLNMSESGVTRNSNKNIVCNDTGHDNSDRPAGDDAEKMEDIKTEAENWFGPSHDESRDSSSSRASNNSPTCEMSDGGDQVESEHNDQHSLVDDARLQSRAVSLQKEKLRLVCKFCMKPFCKGKNPLMNLQKHIMKRCPILHPKRAADESTGQSSECDDRSQIFVCFYCQKSLSTKYNRDRHVETCKRNPNNKVDLGQCTVELFYCEDCNWPTRTELDLHKHRVQNHGAPKKPRKKVTNPKPVACRYCGELFKFTSSRCNHEHFKCPKNLNVTKSFFCRYCGTRCRSQEALDAHTKQKHTDKKCICKLCGAEFNTRNSKWHHMIMTHRENPRRFACSHCNNTYTNKRMLLQHMTKHFDERKVQCTICGKCFKNQVQEKSHRKHVHEGRYRFHCSKCGHGVARRQYLLSHKCGRVRRVQDGEKPIDNSKPKTDVQQPKEQPPLKQSSPDELNNTSLLVAQFGTKPSSEQVASGLESEPSLYYSTQQTSMFPSFTQTISNSRQVVQMPNAITPTITANSYMPNCGILPYPSPNC